MPATYDYPPLVQAIPENWGSVTTRGQIPTVPTYLTNNKWWRVLYYGISRRTSEWNVGSAIKLNGGTQNTSLVLITTGPADSKRPQPTWDWTNYIEDSENIAIGGNDIDYITPLSKAYTRDRLYSIPYP